MEMLFVYLVKSAALVATFWLAYYFLLRKETFFKSNRWYLLFGLVTSVVLPLVTFKKVILVEAQPQIDWNNLPVEMYAPQVVPESPEINWLLVLAIVYSIGIAMFLLRFFTDFYSLKKVLRNQKVYQQADFRFVDTTENISPFSYFNYIVFNSSLYTEAELENILEHEKVHSNQNHTLDVLFARLFCIVFWFNPFVWLYKKSILQNLEFIADNEATKNITDKKSYQITLLKVTAHENCVDITNHFYQSLIKKRIVMLNKNQSKKWNSWKYLLIVPVLAAFMFYFQVNVIAQEKESPKTATVLDLPQERHEVVVNKNTSDGQLKAYAEQAKKEHGVTLKFSKVKRNSNGEITAIKATFKDENGKKGVTQVSSDEPIKPIRFYKNDDGAIGFGTARNRTINVVGYKTDDDDDNGDNATGDDGDEEGFDFNFNVDDAVAVEVPEVPEMPESPEATEMPEMPKGFSRDKIILNDGYGQPTIIVDGKVISGKELDKLDPTTIKEMKVLKGGLNVTGYSYTKNGKDNVVVIDTKRITADAMKQAKEAMERAKPEIERARIQVERSKPEIERARNQIEKSKPQIENARREIERANKQIEEARAQIEQARADLNKQKAEFEKQKATQNKK